MYYCDKCNELSQPSEPLNRVVTQTRNKTYEHVNTLTGEPFYTEGYETVQEQQYCTKCAAERNPQ